VKLIRSLCLVILMVFVVSGISAEDYASPFSKINQAVIDGKINVYDAAILKASVIFRGVDIPGEYKVDNPAVKCLTPYILEIEGVLEDAPQYYRDEYKSLKARPSFSGPEQVFPSPDGHFYIHYTASGVDAPNLTDNNSNGVPDYVEALADAFDSSYDMYHNVIGYLTPPGDGTEGGGNNIYDIYVKSLTGTGALGYTSPEGVSGDNPTYPTRRISFIVMHKALSITQRTSTSAHEYTHATQFAYYYDYNDSARAWMENHAMYNEEVVYPDDNDWTGYVGSRQNRPYLCLWTFESPSFPDSGLFPYGTVIWPFFLNEFIAGFNEGLVLDITETMGQYTQPGDLGYYRQSVAETIESWSSGAYDFASAYTIFSNWNYLVAGLYDGSTYSEGDEFPRTVRLHHTIDATSDIPFYGDGSPVNVNDYYPQTMGSHYNIIENTDTCGYAGLSIHFVGSVTASAAWAYSIAAHDKNAGWTEGWSWLEIENLDTEPFEAFINIWDIQNYDRLVFIVDNTRYVEGVAGRNYEYWIEYLQADGPDASISGDGITFSESNPDPGDTIQVTARIYNLGNENVNSGNVQFSYKPEPDGTVTVISTQAFGTILPGAYTDISVDWNISGSLQPGAYRVMVDLSNILPSDTNSVNNSAYKSIIIGNVAVPVYRFFNTARGGHLYTISEIERDYIMENLPQWTYEGIKFAVYDNLAPGSTAAYRFFNTNTGIHLYTISETERDNVMELPQWNYEGIKFYVHPTEASGTTPVYRFFNHVRGGHLYTISEAERDAVMELPQWTYEGISFYVFPYNP